MVIDFHGEIDLASIKKAVALLSKPSFWMVVLRAAVAVLILAILGTLIFSYTSGEPVPAARAIRMIIPVFFLSYFVIQPYLTSHQLYKRLSAGTHLITGTADPRGVSYNSGANRPPIEYPWDAYYHVYKADDLVVLATADYKISILPRSLFANEQDWKYFRQYVDSRVNPIK